MITLENTKMSTCKENIFLCLRTQEKFCKDWAHFISIEAQTPWHWSDGVTEMSLVQVFSNVKAMEIVHLFIHFSNSIYWLPRQLCAGPF